MLWFVHCCIVVVNCCFPKDVHAWAKGESNAQGPHRGTPPPEIEYDKFSKLMLQRKSLVRVSKEHPAAVRCDMVLHQDFRARLVRRNGIGGEVRHAITSGVSRETSLNKPVTPHLHREYHMHVLCC